MYSADGAAGLLDSSVQVISRPPEWHVTDGRRINCEKLIHIGQLGEETD